MGEQEDHAGLAQAVAAAAESMAEGGAFLTPQWKQITNVVPGGTAIMVPGSGNLWVDYEWAGAPARSIYVWHGGGRTTPIQVGPTSVPVLAGDFLFYALDRATRSIKLNYVLM
jgi:hypothetical protein